jgi:hypothetical protein
MTSESRKIRDKKYEFVLTILDDKPELGTLVSRLQEVGVMLESK